MHTPIMRSNNRSHSLTNLGGPLEAPFSLDEYAERLDRIKVSMSESSIDVLYLSAPESICYVSGHQASWYQGQAATEWHPGSGIAISVDADHYIHFEDEDEKVLLRMSSVSRDVRVREHAGDIAPWAEFVASELSAGDRLQGRRVGLEMWSSRPNRQYSEVFQAALEARGAEVVDATLLVRHLRRSKSPQEIAQVRIAQQIADIGVNAAVHHIRPGMTELELAAEIAYAMTKAGGEIGSPTVVTSGPRSACVHALPTRRVLMPGGKHSPGGLGAPGFVMVSDWRAGW